MSKQDILTNIEIILPKLQQYIQYKETSFEPNELTIVKQIAAQIQPNRIFAWGCSPCAGEALTIIWSWYQREKI